MDGIQGWHALRRARKEDELLSARRSDVEEIGPMQDNFIGGFHPPRRTPPPPLPPKDIPSSRPDNDISPKPSYFTSTELARMTAIERSQILRTARMEPYLQFMVGPLLRYDTVDEQGVWRGATLIVTADSGSVYDPHPMLTYEWDPNSSIPSYQPQSIHSFDLAPHPADPHSTVSSTFLSPPLSPIDGSGTTYGKKYREIVPGHEIYVHVGKGGSFTFWRFLISIPLGPSEMVVRYSINSGQQLEFYVPGRNQNMRWAAHSCNGFSKGVNPDDFCGPGFQSGYDPVWTDLLAKHTETPFHVLVGGGDQLYCDSILREPELQDWVTMKPEDKTDHRLTDEITTTIDRFLFSHYCKAFRRGAFARANCSIPMANMCDDHDLIDGFGSYPDELQRSPIFQRIGERGYFYFLLFQCFINPHVDGYSEEPGKHVSKSVIIGAEGPYIPFRSHSFLGYLGPQCSILLLDCRAERKKDQICSPTQYKKVFHKLSQLPPTVEHLVVQLGVPIAYPRLVFLETALESKLNPLVALGKVGTMGLSGFVNKFNAEAELLDDINDHWTARSHKKERNWFIEQLQAFAKAQRIRVTFLSGDVHCAAVGVLKTLKAKNQMEVPPSIDHRYMLNVVTSAIVNTPPPAPAIAMVSSLATKVHKTLHHADTDEAMLPIFQTDTDGSPRKLKYIMGRRNWCQVGWDPNTGELNFDLRVEKEKGLGQTIGYNIRIPPPGWARSY